MRKFIKYLPVLLLSVCFTSCLKSNLDDLPAYSDSAITNFKFEYRWLDDSGNYDQLNVIQLKTDITIDEDLKIVDCIITVPAVSADFPQAVRNQVELSNITGYADISTAATMESVGDSPKLGMVSDFSKVEMKYNVTAADGSISTWNLIVSAFNK